MEITVVQAGTFNTCKAPVKSPLSEYQHSFSTGRIPFLSPNQQCQNTEGTLTDITQLEQYPKIFPSNVNNFQK